MASCENFQGFLLVIRGEGGISGEKEDKEMAAVEMVAVTKIRKVM